MNQVRLAGNVTVPPAVCPLPRAVSPGCCISDAASAAIAGSTISVFASFAIEDSDGFRPESTPISEIRISARMTLRIWGRAFGSLRARKDFNVSLGYNTAPNPTTVECVRPLTAKTGVRVP